MRKTGYPLTPADIKILPVKVTRLDTLLSTLEITKIDILSIDVEGWELDVMNGFDTTKTHCTLIVVENFLNNPEYRKYFESLGYTLTDKVQYNEIYTKK